MLRKKKEKDFIGMFTRNIDIEFILTYLVIWFAVQIIVFVQVLTKKFTYNCKFLILYRVFCFYLLYPQKSLNGMSFEDKFLELLILLMPVSTLPELDR